TPAPRRRGAPARHDRRGRRPPGGVPVEALSAHRRRRAGDGPHRACPAHRPGGPARVRRPEPGGLMLSVRKLTAGRRAADYYLEQTRRGLAAYYLDETGDESTSRQLAAPGTAWWGGGARVLGLDG